MPRVRSVVLAMAFFGFVLLPETAHGQTTYVVTTTADCTGCGSLRDALAAAASSTGGSVIDLRPVSGTINLTQSFSFPNQRQVDMVGNGNITINASPGVSLRWDDNIVSRPTVSGVSFGDIEIRLANSTRLVTATDNVFTSSTRLVLDNAGGALIGSTTQHAATVHNVQGNAGTLAFDANGRLNVGQTGRDSDFWMSGSGPTTAQLHKVGTGTLFLMGSQFNPTVVVDRASSRCGLKRTAVTPTPDRSSTTPVWISTPTASAAAATCRAAAVSRFTSRERVRSTSSAPVSGSCCSARSITPAARSYTPAR